MIKAVLFDFYGVFLPDAYEMWLQNNGLRREGVFADIIERSNRSNMTEDEFLQALSEAIGRPVLAGEIHSSNPVLNTELVELVRDLKPRYTIGLLSNASVRLRAKLQKFDIDNLFNTIIISSEIGHTKPSSEAFKIAIEKLDTSADEIIFIDDNPENVTAASRSGMQSLHYTGIEKLRDDLKSLQVI